MRHGSGARWQVLGILVASLLSGSAGAALYGFGPAEAWTIQQITELATVISNDLAVFGSTFGTNMATKFEELISAIAVATKQEALAGNIVTDATRESANQLTNAVHAQHDSDAIASTVLDYNPSTGQGYQPCRVNAANRTLDAAFDSVGASAKSSVATLDVAPGRMVASTGAALTQRLADHRAKFCSQAEANAGLCTLSSLPSGDVNGDLLFEPTAPSSLQQQAQRAYLQHVLGDPDPIVAPGAGKSAAGQQYMLLKNSKDALLSIPAYSLSMIQAANTQSADFDSKSPNEMLTLRVDQYFGGKEAQQWSSVLAAQSERGLMVEAVKMGGLETWLHYKQYQQGQRLELNLAALAIAAAQEAKANVDAKYNKVVRDTAAGAIK
jgi:hypothetical protein